MERNPPGKASFSVRANPVFHESGDLAGKLEYVRFTADSGGGVHKEWRVAPAQLDQALHSLESGAIRYQVLNNIQSGARVDLPGRFSESQLASLGCVVPVAGAPPS